MIALKKFLKSKGVNISVQSYLINALSFMALGLFSSLLIGLIFKTIGEQIAITTFVEISTFAMDAKIVGAAIGIAVAYSLKAPPLVLFSVVTVGAFGNYMGGPAGSFIAALLATEIGKLIYKSTKIDIILVPLGTILIGYFLAKFIGIPINSFMVGLGNLINWSTELHPITMSIVVATLMGLSLTAPISSAALALMLNLDGVAAGAAVIGCAAQMVGFAVISFKDNGVSGLIAQGIGTSMLQIANIIKNPFILLPPTIAGIICAPIAITLFKMTNNKFGAGMGTSGFVGQFMAFESMGFSLNTAIMVLIFHILMPAIISIGTAYLLFKKGYIKKGDMKLNYE